MKMSAYDQTMELIRKGDERLLGLLKLCLDFVLKNGREKHFAAKWLLGDGPMMSNLRGLTMRGLIEKVSRSSRQVYYRMPDPEGVRRALAEN